MIKVLLAHLSWMLNHIMCVHYYKQVVSAYITIPPYHIIHIKQGQACISV